MKQIAVLSADSVLNRKISYYCSKVSKEFDAVFLKGEQEALEFLNYELPEICIINLSDRKLSIDQILASLLQDPWFHFGGIVGLHSAENENALEEKLKSHNIISLISQGEFAFSFPRLLRILNNNRQILFQRDIQSQFLSSISGSFIIDNDPFDIKTYSHLITNYLYNANFLDRDRKDRLHVALMELLINAIEHGNCKISYKEKSRWLESGKTIFELIRKKNQDGGVGKRKVFLEYRINPVKTSFLIRDEGDGFDWRNRVRRITEKNFMMLHGRGIMMADHYVRELTYNDKGNEVSFIFEHVPDQGVNLPGAFEKEREVVFTDGQTIFTEGEESNFLYYIVSGKLNIVSRGKVISHLTPNDIFLGEMAFLLNNRRSATVVSEGRSVLLQISKKAFVTAIKENPHYGIFLARLLAHRLDRANQLIS